MSVVSAMIMFSLYALFLHVSVVKYQCRPYEPTDQCDVGLYEVIIQSLVKSKEEPRPAHRIMAIMKSRCVMKNQVGTKDVYNAKKKKTETVKIYRYTAMYVDMDEESDNVFMDDTQSQEFHDHRRFERLEFPAEQTKICKVQ